MHNKTLVPAINQFELEREDRVLRIVFRSVCQLAVLHVKEILRLVGAMDPAVHTGVVVECPEGLEVGEASRMMLARACRSACRPVAIHTPDLDLRLQTELFRAMHRPAFPMRVFHSGVEAQRWVHDQIRAREMSQPTDPDVPGQRSLTDHGPRS